VAKDVTLLIKLNDQASGKINKVTNSTKRLEKAANGAQNSIRRTSKGIRDTGRAADQASKGVNKLGKAIRGLVAGFGVFQAGKFVIFKTAELERQTKSLEVLTGSLGNARSIIKELQQFGAVTPFTSSELVETAKRLKAFGFETEQIVDVTKRLADVAGATGADLGGIATAFGQIQAKGRLQGEELLQLQERGIGLQDELQKMYGMTGEEFRKALEGGRISAEAVNVALQNITNEGGKYANGAIAQSETLSGKFSTLVDNITVLAQHIGDALSPALKGILSLTNQILAGFNDILSSQVARGVFTTKLAMLAPGGTMGDIAQMRANVAAMPTTTLRDEASIQETARRLTDISNFVRELGTAIETRRPGGTSQQERDALLGLQGLIQTQLGALGRRQVQIAAEDKPTVVKPPKLLDRTGATADPLAALKSQIETLKEGVLLAKTRTKEEERQQTLLNSIAALTRIRTDDNAELVDEAIKLTGQLFYQEGLQRQAAEADKKRQEAAKKLNELYKGIGDTIASSIVQSLQEAVKGTAKLADIATSMLNRLIDQFIQLALVQASGIGGPIGAIAGFLSGGRANGGTVMGGRSYVVGERGPELFTPGRTGSIAPNSAIGGDTSVVVNVDASGTEVQGNQGNADQLGRLIGQAVQAELIKQKRPGGLLTR
jgi:tape measure domain-containing protein